MFRPCSCPTIVHRPLRDVWHYYSARSACDPFRHLIACTSSLQIVGVEMFTGIVEEMGVVKSIEKTLAGAKLSLLASIVVDDLGVGDSISVNGACLTVTFHGRSRLFRRYLYGDAIRHLTRQSGARDAGKYGTRDENSSADRRPLGLGTCRCDGSDSQSSAGRQYADHSRLRRRKTSCATAFLKARLRSMGSA